MKLLYSAVDTFPPKSEVKTYETMGTISRQRLSVDNNQVIPLGFEKVTFGKTGIRVWLDRSTVSTVELRGNVDVRKPKKGYNNDVDIFILRNEGSSIKFQEGPGMYEFESVE